jgi:glycosyltransferase involved in cell wall biosynthesis
LNVLLIGIDYFSERGSGDKNFWYRLLPMLAETAKKIVVVSFNYRPITVETRQMARGIILTYNVRPAHIGIDLYRDPSTLHNREKCHAHFKSPPRSPLEYLLSFVRIRPLVQRLVAEHGITNIHFMDNFGPVMRFLKDWISPMPLSVSAMGYYARGPLHDRYLQLCFRSMDAIVPYSEAYRCKLLELGLPAKRLHAIPWGIDIESVGEPATSEERARFKRSLEIESSRKLVLWTGFIQQIKERELHASLEIAQNLIRQRGDTHFVFALKPECYRPSYQSFATPQIRLLSTTNEVFLRLLRAADYLLSPVTNIGSIVTPPLTWLEAMAVGVPVVTNKLAGVEAVILPGENGFVAESVAAIPALLDRVLSQEKGESIRQQAREHVLNHYSMTQSTVAYQSLWERLRNGQP